MPVYIYNILRQIHPDLSLTKESNDNIHLYISQLVKKIASTSISNVIGDNELLRYARHYHGTVVSPAIVNKMIGVDDEKDNLVFLSGVVEYLIAEILELSGNSAMDHKRRRITMMDVDYAMRYDTELMHAYRLLSHNALVEWRPPLPTEKNSMEEIRYSLGKHNIIPMTQDLGFPTKYTVIRKKKDLLAFV